MSDNKTPLEELLAKIAMPLQADKTKSPTSKDPFHLPEEAGPLTATPANAVGSKVLRALIFLRLVNGDNNLSISNIAVLAILVKLCLEPSIDLASAATLLTVIGGYQFKRYINSKGEV